jgi:hypothetical protein
MKVRTVKFCVNARLNVKSGHSFSGGGSILFCVLCSR